MVPIIRKCAPEDKPFILATMLRGIRHGCSDMMHINSAEFFSHYSAQAEALLNSPFCHIRVACLPDDADFIVGYIVGFRDKESLVWCYTKSLFRKQGVLNLLMADYEWKYCTNITAIGNVIRLKKKLAFIPWRV